MPRTPAFTPYRPWQPLSDQEWAILAPYVWRAGPGRPADHRRTLDAIFWLDAADHRVPWRDLPAQFGKADTVHRQFRRWAASGLWHTLLKALSRRSTPGRAILQAIASWLCRAYRRAWRIHGLAGVMLPKSLGLLSAQRGPSWLLADPVLSEQLWPTTCDAIAGLIARERFPKGYLRSLKYILRSITGNRSVPRNLVWP